MWKPSQSCPSMSMPSEVSLLDLVGVGSGKDLLCVVGVDVAV